MIKRAVVALGLFSIIVAPPLWASTAWDWSEFRKVVIERNPQLMANNARLVQSESALKLAEAGLLPDVSLTTRVANQSALSYGIAATQTLFDGFQKGEMVVQARYAYIAAKADYDEALALVIFDARETFISALQNQNLVRIAKEIVKRRQDNYALVKLRYDAGREHLGAVLTAKANLAQAEFELHQNQNLLHLDLLRLTKLTGESSSVRQAVNGAFLSPIMGERPDFLALSSSTPTSLKKEAQKNAAASGMKIAQSDHWPTLTGALGLNKTLDDGRYDIDAWSATASLSFSLWDFGRKDAGISKSKAAYQEVSYDYQNTVLEEKIALESAWIHFLEAIQNVAVQQQFFDAAKARSKIAGAQYSNGLLTFDNWTIIEDNLVRSQRTYFQSIGTAMKAQASYHLKRGGIGHDYQ